VLPATTSAPPTAESAGPGMTPDAGRDANAFQGIFSGSWATASESQAARGSGSAALVRVQWDGPDRGMKRGALLFPPLLNSPRHLALPFILRRRAICWKSNILGSLIAAYPGRYHRWDMRARYGSVCRVCGQSTGARHTGSR
jgi:hypothetical protein